GDGAIGEGQGLGEVLGEVKTTAGSGVDEHGHVAFERWRFDVDDEVLAVAHFGANDADALWTQASGGVHDESLVEVVDGEDQVFEDADAQDAIDLSVGSAKGFGEVRDSDIEIA